MGQPVVLHRPAEPLPEALDEAVRAAGLDDQPSVDGPPPPGDGPALYLETVLWQDALGALLPANAPAALVRWGGPPTGPVPGFALPKDAPASLLATILSAAAQVATARAAAAALARRLSESEERVSALNKIGIALSAERDLDRLLEKILTESRRFTGSEAGSLYLLEEGPHGKRLRFKLAQNDAVRFAFSERTMPVDDGSLAGYVAGHGDPVNLDDAYAVPAGAPYRHNTAFDEQTGWRTRSMIVVPMSDHTGALVGVLQLMNRRLPDGAHAPYPADLVPLLLSLATQAAVSVKANQLTASIRRLFEDFARAAIMAVELRDPTTAGHSNRVADLSVALARVVDRAADGPYARVAFSREEIRELQTAALLHDFGKISIPERVLVKAKKLDDDEVLRIRDRFDFALEAEDAQDGRTLLHRLLEAGVPPSAEDVRQLDLARWERAQELEEVFEEVRRANEPTVLPEEAGGTLRRLLTRSFRDRRGVVTPLLNDFEFQLLSIRKGSLSIEERTQIESHVSHTYRFLSSIPWTADLARVPEIAHAHHEKLDGNGYPRGLKADQIPVPARIMAICDIYDALTAADRPYKRSVPREKALRILEDEGRAGLLDPWLVTVFVSEKIWVPAGHP
ncbi:MAG: GAF domain-containing protein [Holophagales bacterium]|nr:GAF domain-containing protein [Holophagales bacterium]MBK9966702.1 GAF domain-containing protein [Holophagales bacterium]